MAQQKRKLQSEIDNTLKLVSNGLAAFDAIYGKWEGASTPVQKEKEERELEKEIKKLQRQRGQLKAWFQSGEAKDRSATIDEARHKIERAMEKFKACEKETKVKAFSNEGLAQKDKMNPHEKERGKHREWVRKAVKRLQTVVELKEGEIEASRSEKTAKKQIADPEKVANLAKLVEQLRWHLLRLEPLLRRLENDTVHLSHLDEIKDTVEFYLEGVETSGSPADCLAFFDEDTYTSLDLEEVASDSAPVNSGDGSRRQSDLAADEAAPRSARNSTSAGQTSFSGSNATMDGAAVSNSAGASKGPYGGGKGVFVSQQSEEGKVKPADEAGEPTTSGNEPLPSDDVHPARRSSEAASSDDGSASVKISSSAGISSMAIQPLAPGNANATEEGNSNGKRVSKQTESRVSEDSDYPRQDASQPNAVAAPQKDSVPESPSSGKWAPKISRNVDPVTSCHEELTPHLTEVLRSIDASAKHIVQVCDTQRPYNPWRSRFCESWSEPPLSFPAKALPNHLSSDFYRQLSTATLFWVFHWLPGTQLQILAARELKARRWHFHKERLLWIRPLENIDPSTAGGEIIQTQEFEFFDPETSTRSTQRLSLNLSAVESELPPANVSNGSLQSPPYLGTAQTRPFPGAPPATVSRGGPLPQLQQPRPQQPPSHIQPPQHHSHYPPAQQQQHLSGMQAQQQLQQQQQIAGVPMRPPVPLNQPMPQGGTVNGMPYMGVGQNASNPAAWLRRMAFGDSQLNPQTGGSMRSGHLGVPEENHQSAAAGAPGLPGAGAPQARRGVPTESEILGYMVQQQRNLHHAVPQQGHPANGGYAARESVDARTLVSNLLQHYAPPQPHQQTDDDLRRMAAIRRQQMANNPHFQPHIHQ